MTDEVEPFFNHRIIHLEEAEKLDEWRSAQRAIDAETARLERLRNTSG